jgi:hypothetical protein
MRLLDKDPAKRPRASDSLQDPFFLLSDDSSHAVIRSLVRWNEGFGECS